MIAIRKLFMITVLNALWFTGSCGTKVADSPRSPIGTLSKELPSSAAPIVEKPSEILAWATLPRGLEIPDVVKAIDNIIPGMNVSATLSEFLSQQIDLSNIDTNAPISAFVTNPKLSDIPVLFVVKPSDLAALRLSTNSSDWKVTSRQGLAILHIAKLSEEIQNWALLSHERSALTTTLRLFPRDILREFGDDIDSLMSTIPTESTQFLALYGLSLEEMAAQIDFVELQLGSDDSESDLYIRFQPVASTTLAALSKAQKPSQFELLRHLPPVTGQPMVMAGDFHSGTASKAIMNFSLKMTSKLAPGLDYEKNLELLTEVFEVLDGKFAMTMLMDISQLPPKMSMTYLMGTTDSEVVQKNWRTMMHMQTKLGTQETMGMTTKSEFVEKVDVKDGVAIDRNSSQVTTAGIEVSMLGHFATFDNLAVMSMSNDSLATVSQIVASARGKQLSTAPSADIVQTVKRSLSRKESAFFHMNLASMLPQDQIFDSPVSQLTLAFGQENGALTLRISGRK